MSPRLAINGRFLSQATTGTQRYAYELLRRLVQRHPDRVVVHVPHGTVVPPELASAARVRVSRARGQLFEQVVLPWLTRDDLLVSLGGPAPVGARRQVATLHDVSVLAHGDTYSAPFRTWYRSMYWVLARRAERVLTVSAFSAGEIVRTLGVGAERIGLVPNGADHLDQVTPCRPSQVSAEGLDLPEQWPWVLCVGTLARHKNLGPALDALEAAAIPSVVVGDRGSSAVFAEADTGRWTRAHFAGRLSDAELVWLYEHAAALVFPSLYEGFGVPVVEAQRLGCPVVALDTPVMTEVAGAGALLCDPARPEQVVQAVCRLVADADFRAATVAAGRRNAERYRWDHSADLLEAELARVGWSW